MNHAQSPRSLIRPPIRSGELGFLASFSRFFTRLLDEDMIVHGDSWLKESGVQQQLEFEGYQLRWVQANRVDLSLGDGWGHVTAPRYLWWMRRIRRRHGAQHQYLMKKGKSFRSQSGY